MRSSAKSPSPAPGWALHNLHTPLWATCLVVGASLILAVAGASERAAGWNDGSRFAMVESLVDRHTLAIDDSLFVTGAGAGSDGAAWPSPTRDKLWVDGHWYSDKTPVPGLLLAVIYQGWEWITGQTAAGNLSSFVWWLALGSSGLAYVVAVWCLFCLGGVLGVELRGRLLLTASLALATLAPIYAREVNNHIVLLATAAALCLGLAQLARSLQDQGKPRGLLFGLGLLVGLGYATDQGAGPVLLLCACGLVAYRCRSLRLLLPFLAGMAPCLLVHHACNYAVAGTFVPANAVPAYVAWPGNPCDRQHMTGVCNHAGLGHFLLYAGQLLVGRRGFLGHNLALFLILPVLGALYRRRPFELPEMLFGLAWSAGTFLLYALESTNGGGQCQSVRWFVPLLAPGYYVLTVMWRDLPDYRRLFLFLSAWGLLLTALSWPRGAWNSSSGWYYWPIQGLALLTVLASQHGLFRRSKLVAARFIGPQAPRPEVACFGGRSL
jgi:hypothetical protein